MIVKDAHFVTLSDILTNCIIIDILPFLKSKTLLTAHQSLTCALFYQLIAENFQKWIRKWNYKVFIKGGAFSIKHPVVTKYLIQIGTLHYLSNITEGSNNSVGGDIFTHFNKSEGFLLSIMYFLIKV